LGQRVLNQGSHVACRCVLCDRRTFFFVILCHSVLKTRVWWERPKERDHSEDRGLKWEGSEWILGRSAGGGVDSVSLGHGPVAGSCEHGDEPSSCGATEIVRYV
jgi:hypothetical protein